MLQSGVTDGSQSIGGVAELNRVPHNLANQLMTIIKTKKNTDEVLLRIMKVTPC